MFLRVRLQSRHFLFVPKTLRIALGGGGDCSLQPFPSGGYQTLIISLPIYPFDPLYLDFFLLSTVGPVYCAGHAVITGPRPLWDLMAKFKDVIINHSIIGMPTPFGFLGDANRERTAAGSVSGFDDKKIYKIVELLFGRWCECRRRFWSVYVHAVAL